MWTRLATLLPLLHVCRAVQVNFIKEDPQAVGYVYKNTNGFNKLYYRLGSNQPAIMEYNKKVGVGKYYKTRRDMAKQNKELVPNEQPFVQMENVYAIPTNKDAKTQITKYISNRHTRPSYHTNPVRVDLPTNFNVPPSTDVTKNLHKVYAEKYYSTGLRTNSNKDIYMVKSPDNYYFPFDDYSPRGYESKDVTPKGFDIRKPKTKSWRPDYNSKVDLNGLVQGALLKKLIDSKLQAEDRKLIKNKGKKEKTEQSTSKPRENQNKSDNQNQHRRDQSTSRRVIGSNNRREPLVNGYSYKKNHDLKNYDYMNVTANRKFLPMEYSQIAGQFGYNLNNMKDRVRASRNLRHVGITHHATAPRMFRITGRTRRITY